MQKPILCIHMNIYMCVCAQTHFEGVMPASRAQSFHVETNLGFVLTIDPASDLHSMCMYVCMYTCLHHRSCEWPAQYVYVCQCGCGYVCAFVLVFLRLFFTIEVVSDLRSTCVWVSVCVCVWLRVCVCVSLS